MPFTSWSDAPSRERPGNRVLRVLNSDRATLLRVEHHGPAMHERHAHDESEQISVLLEGQMEFTVGEETRIVRPGDVVIVPPGIPHATRVAAGVEAVALEYFTPPRQDLRTT